VARHRLDQSFAPAHDLDALALPDGLELGPSRHEWIFLAEDDKQAYSPECRKRGQEHQGAFTASTHMAEDMLRTSVNTLW